MDITEYNTSVNLCRPIDINVVVEKKFDQLEDFLNAISPSGELYELRDKDHIFRGVSSESYKLIPSALRKNNQTDILRLAEFSSSRYIKDEGAQRLMEYRILQKFFIKSDYCGIFVSDDDKLRKSMLQEDLGSSGRIRDNWMPSSFYELAGLAQHYGLPTRLLDWSKDIYVALYFASIGGLKKANDDFMVLWILCKNKMELSEVLDGKFPLKIITPPYYRNPNLAAQKGVFTLWNPKSDSEYEKKEVNYTPLDLLLKEYAEFIYKPNIGYCTSSLSSMPYIFEKVLYKIKIPVTESKKLYEYIQSIGYDASRLFPGYSGIVKSMKEDSLVGKNNLRII